MIPNPQLRNKVARKYLNVVIQWYRALQGRRGCYITAMLVQSKKCSSHVLPETFRGDLRTFGLFTGRNTLMDRNRTSVLISAEQIATRSPS